MIGSPRRKKGSAGQRKPAALPKGVKVVSTPMSDSYRDLISGPDITVSGGCHTVHFKHFLGVGNQIYFLIDISPLTNRGGYRAEIIPIPRQDGQRLRLQDIETFDTTTSTRQEAQMHGRTTYAQAVLQACAVATRRFQDIQSHLAVQECKAHFADPDFQRPNFSFEVVESRDWKESLRQLRSDGQIDDQWIETVARKTQSKLVQETLADLAKSRLPKS